MLHFHILCTSVCVCVFFVSLLCCCCCFVFWLIFCFFCVFFVLFVFFWEERGGGRGQGVHVGDGRRFKELYLKFFGVIPLSASFHAKLLHSVKVGCCVHVYNSHSSPEKMQIVSILLYKKVFNSSRFYTFEPYHVLYFLLFLLDSLI